MMTATVEAFQPYTSLDALEHASDGLIASMPDDERSISDSEGESISQRIALFIDQATMTGTVLDAPADRKAAQAIVDFWLAKSFTIPGAPRAKPRTSTKANSLLKPFDHAAVMSAKEKGNAVMASLRDKDAEDKSLMRRVLPRVLVWRGDKATDYGNLARRILLRTVRMDDTERSCSAVTVGRNDLLALGDPERTNEVIDAFVAAGVLGVASRESGDLISLRYEALTRDWETLSSLISKRVGFRDAAIFWGQRARARGALISAGMADEALADYADLNAQERAFIAASSSYSRHKIIAVSAVCIIVFSVFGFVSKRLYDRWMAAKEEAEAAAAVLVAISNADVHSKEESIRKLASFHKPLDLQSVLLKDLDLNGIYAGANSPAIAKFVNSAMLKVNLAGAHLPYALFSQGVLQGVNFTGADLQSARFDGAVITSTKFSGTNLYRAIFDRAQFDDVDFSDTDLRSTSFRNVGTNGEFNFTGTAWWLGLGWKLPQIDKFAKKYQDPKIEEAKVFKNDVASRRKEADDAVGHPEDLVDALNGVAWTYVIYGADPKIAKEYARKASKILNEIKKTKEKSDWISSKNAALADTMAYISLQEGQPVEAVKLLEFDVIPNNPAGDSMFRYAVALHALALEKEGEEKEQLEQKAQTYLDNSLGSRNYVPSHELYLLRSYITGKFRDKLVADLIADAN